MSQDEVFEWAVNMSAKYKKNPMYYIGCVDTYLSFSNNISEALKKIEEREIANEKQKNESL